MDLKGDKGDPGEKGSDGAKGEKGDKGDSGVYVGSDEMPEGYNVQINPSGETINIPDVLQTTGDSETDTMSQKAITEVIVGLKALLENMLIAIQEGGTTSSTISEIEQLLISYLENISVAEVEGQ